MTTEQRGGRSPLRPLVVGDVVSGLEVAGFTWVQPVDEDRYLSTHLDDRLLVVGEERLADPPLRLVPQTSETAIPCGIVPPGHALRYRADDIGPTISGLFNNLLNLAGAPWQPLIRPLLTAVHAAGHRLWLAGGAVRDVLSGVPLHQVRDLDLCGTVQPGRFSELVREALRFVPMPECRTTVTPNSLVCAVRSARSQERLIEYRGLSQSGFLFPAVGSALAEDARHRDFSFNALIYDMVDELIFDSSGTGVEDLLRRPRRFRPIKASTDPMIRAEVIVRGLKFAYRWRKGPACDFTNFHNWIDMFPPDFCCGFGNMQWGTLVDRYRKCALDAQWAAGFAAKLPPVGCDFVTTLIGRAG